MSFLVFQGVSLESDLLTSAADLVAISATVLLLVMLVALGGFVYKSLHGDGIRWPDDIDEEETERGVKHSRTDDEWKYY